jgi:hypothetical protein
MSNKIHAYAINDVHITVKCPHCSNQRRTSSYHRHGSNGKLYNREESRLSHCSTIRYETIVIDNNTLRCDLGKSGKPLKRSFKKYLHDKFYQ